MMKKISKVFLILFTCTLFFSCDNQDVIEDVLVTDSSLARSSEISPDVEFLQSQTSFNTAVLLAIEEINSFFEQAQSKINIENIETEEGYLVFPNSESFQKVHQNIETVDEEYQVFLDEKYDMLLEIAIENTQILEFYESDHEEIINGIEDLMWHHNIHDYNLQQYVSLNLPINTLWSKVKLLTDQWLEESEEELNMENDPSDFYVDNEYLQLLLNENSNIKISGNLELYDEVEGGVSSEIQTRAQSCITRLDKRVAQSRRRKITVKVFVRDYGGYKEAGASIIGYKKRRRWKRRRFGKNLVSAGYVVYNAIFNCETEVYAAKSRSSKRRRFRAIALRSYSQEHNLRVIPYMKRFGAAGNGGGVHISAFYL